MQLRIIIKHVFYQAAIFKRRRFACNSELHASTSVPNGVTLMHETTESLKRDVRFRAAGKKFRGFMRKFPIRGILRGANEISEFAGRIFTRIQNVILQAHGRKLLLL